MPTSGAASIAWPPSTACLPRAWRAAPALIPPLSIPSKRITREGRPRWPSTESVAKILTVTGESFASFVSLTGAPGSGEGPSFQGGKLAGRGAVGKSIPVVALARLSAESCFDQNGHPTGSAWGRVNAPGIVDRSAFAIEINGHDFDPVYRDGDLIIASPEAEVRRGDRIVVGARLGHGVVAPRRPPGGRGPVSGIADQQRDRFFPEEFRNPLDRARRLGQPVSFQSPRLRRLWEARAIGVGRSPVSLCTETRFAVFPNVRNLAKIIRDRYART